MGTMKKYISLDYMWNLIPQEFYFVRHGQTDYNKNKLFTGRTDVELNQNGIQQATKLGNAFHKFNNISACWTSPMKRTIDTSKLIIQDKAIDIYLNDSIMERASGSWDGKPYSVAKKNRLPFDVETMPSMQKRVLAGLSEIYLESKEKNLEGIPLIVGHGGVFRSLIESLSMEYLRSAVPNGIPIHIYRNSYGYWNYEIIEI